ncbi:hydantoinase/oxoprolinase family protein [Sphingobium sp. Sx8-8]|uniref:hydantoinase/oxoprolinase family protein n=1 Tax=Sphingobium sp. Sx8-8 TaxID=2933617 RepID=UPI001F561B73
MTFKISVDAGSRFTDVIISNFGGKARIGKTITNDANPFAAVCAALDEVGAQIGIPKTELLRNCDYFIYGTSYAHDAIVSRSVAKTAFVTTEGFPDILLLREGGKSGPFDFSQDFPDPFIPRRHTFEIGGRISAEGDELYPFDGFGARALARTLRDREYEAVAICLLWSVADPSHELRFAEILKELAPDLPFTLSHQLLPIVREYRRASATALDASLKPLMRRHLVGLEEELRAVGFAGQFLVNSAAGGCLPAQAAIEKPIYTVRSGPAMAPIAGRIFSQMEGMGSDIIVCDLGGTSLDVGLVKGGRITVSRDVWVGPPHTGDLLGISAVDVRSVGAGTGAIAWVDDGGLLRIGPQSAGSDPGPACYGHGGDAPTVFDAAAMLGYVPADDFLGGKMALDLDAAHRAIGTLATRLGVEVHDAARNIMMLASNQMACAIHDVAISQGMDPRESTIVGGGAIGLHIMDIAEELGCSRVIMPRAASVLSAAGMQYADIVVEEAASLLMRTDSFDLRAANNLLADLHHRLSVFAAGLTGYDLSEASIEYMVEARYAGQIWELETSLPHVPLDDESSIAALVASFHAAHQRAFAMQDEGSAVEVVNWKARLVVPLGNGINPPTAVEPRRDPASPLSRSCHFGSKAVAAIVYGTGDLVPGLVLRGPAIVEEPAMTILVPPDMSVTVSEAGNFLLSPVG